VPAALVAVVGTDTAGTELLRQAAHDGIAISGVVRRGVTALLIDLIDAPASRRLLEDVPASALVNEADVERAAELFRGADTVSIQLQQPAPTAMRAAHLGRQAGARIVADGAIEPAVSDELLPLVDVWRADAHEAEMLAGEPVRSSSAALLLAEQTLARGPSLIAMEVRDVGDLLVWRGGHKLFPFAAVPVIDRTGAGDAFTAALITALRGGAEPEHAGAFAAAAAAATVQHLGGRPQLEGLAR
jgi:ribokinase